MRNIKCRRSNFGQQSLAFDLSQIFLKRFLYLIRSHRRFVPATLRLEIFNLANFTKFLSPLSRLMHLLGECRHQSSGTGLNGHELWNKRGA